MILASLPRKLDQPPPTNCLTGFGIKYNRREARMNHFAFPKTRLSDKGSIHNNLNSKKG